MNGLLSTVNSLPPSVPLSLWLSLFLFLLCIFECICFCAVIYVVYICASKVSVWVVVAVGVFQCICVTVCERYESICKCVLDTWQHVDSMLFLFHSVCFSVGVHEVYKKHWQNNVIWCKGWKRINTQS